MDFNSLTEEQKARMKACKTPEEIRALAREEGYELSDEELEAVVGGLYFAGALKVSRDHDSRKSKTF